MIILDCTLRDGGYYNNWDFSRETVDNYLNSMSNANIDVVELGFRSLPKNSFYGPYIYTTDDFIKELNLPKNIRYSVMINGKDFIDSLGGNSTDVRKIFKKNNPIISIVRIAVNFDDVLESYHLAKELNELGYFVILNMMQANGKSKKEYIDTSDNINNWDIIKVLYFADSLGNMSPDDVENISENLLDGFDGPIGIHTHNNKGYALINSISAINKGVTWCDGTVNGMGRGAGNVTTESLVIELSRMGKHKSHASMLQPTIDNFSELRGKYNWGPNMYYHLAANNGIHPTFVQTLLEDKRYDNQQVLSAIRYLSDRDSVSFNINTIRKAIYGNDNDIEGEWNATEWISDQEALIIGAGPSVEIYRDGIMAYIEKNKSKVIFLNINRYLPSSIACATIASHETRVLFDSQYYQNLHHPIILPKSRFGILLEEKIKGLEIFDYGLNLEKDAFEIGPNSCRLEWPLAIAYALAVVTQGCASKISLVGFDGYIANDPRQDEINKIFEKYSTLDKNLEVKSLTPTTYRIKQNSIYSPIN